jgi:hypothetical protein
LTSFRRDDACVALNRHGGACSPVMSRIASHAVPCEEMAENHSARVETAMLKSRTYAKCRPQPVLLAALLVGLLLSLQTSAADTARQGTQSTALYLAVRNILSTGTTVTGEPIRYPSGAPALITAVEITLQPGQQTGWHIHPVPLLGYILEGELTVDYGLQGERVYRWRPLWRDR